jgi:hypothetical protein
LKGVTVGDDGALPHDANQDVVAAWPTTAVNQFTRLRNSVPTSTLVRTPKGYILRR